MGVLETWEKKYGSTRFRPQELADSLAQTDHLIAAGVYDDEDSYLLYPEGKEELELEDKELLVESINHFLRNDSEYRQVLADMSRDLNSTIRNWENRTEIVLYGNEDDRGFVALLDPSVSKTGNTYDVARTCREILDGEDSYSQLSI